MPDPLNRSMEEYSIDELSVSKHEEPAPTNVL